MILASVTPSVNQLRASCSGRVCICSPSGREPATRLNRCCSVRVDDGAETATRTFTITINAAVTLAITLPGPTAKAGNAGTVLFPEPLRVRRPHALQLVGHGRRIASWIASHPRLQRQSDRGDADSEGYLHIQSDRSRSGRPAGDAGDEHHDQLKGRGGSVEAGSEPLRVAARFLRLQRFVGAIAVGNALSAPPSPGNTCENA